MITSLDTLRPSEDPPVSSYNGNPLIDWMIDSGWQNPEPRELVAGLAATMLKLDIPIWRIRVTIRTLHPSSSARPTRGSARMARWRSSRRVTRSWRATPT